MQFVRYGVTLERLERGHLETVRQWRNSPWVRLHMRWQGLVQPEPHVQWFEGLDPERNWYFTAQVGNTRFALFHVKAIDWSAASGESGGFVGDPGFIGRPEAALATLALMDFAFHLLNLQSLEAQYSAKLHRIVRFNHQLGYVIFREEADGFVRARVTADRYFACAAAFRRAAATLHGNAAVLASPDPWLAQHLERHPATQLEDFQLQWH
jgi:RimJ/RimL family protein N-acetyltransferase